MRRIAIACFLAATATACGKTPAARDDTRCASARTEATRAWDAVLPPMKAAADTATRAASNCDGPTRDRPPCSGRMSDRFLDQSVTAARLSEVQAARDAAALGDALAMRETAREVKDAPQMAAAKSAAEGAYAICKGPPVAQ